jgi:hypothetical protein
VVGTAPCELRCVDSVVVWSRAFLLAVLSEKSSSYLKKEIKVVGGPTFCPLLGDVSVVPVCVLCC